ncbi:6801_t:CDS:2 [Cetraspora pellucida]|uniref:6801_t:CDS:1 n=1 Tax=Cetraspora pellucida TaxID=1433469 RepID=A0A9N9AJ66_9GLOM|nr:6801_t:CDS:2 [Cetraspora pellucida]
MKQEIYKTDDNFMDEIKQKHSQLYQVFVLKSDPSGCLNDI